LFDICAGTRQVWSVQQKSALRDLLKTAALKRKPPTKNEILEVQQKNRCLVDNTWQQRGRCTSRQHDSTAE